MNTSEAKQAQIKTMANAGWPVARISENLKVSVKTVQRVLQDTSKGVEERAPLRMKTEPCLRAPQISSAQAESGIDPSRDETLPTFVDPAKSHFGYAAKSRNTSAKAESGIDPSRDETLPTFVDPALTIKRLTAVVPAFGPKRVSAKLRMQAIEMLQGGETDLFIGVVTGLNPEQIARIKKEYESAKADSGIDHSEPGTPCARVDPATPLGASQETPHHAAKPVQVMAAPGDQICLTIMELQARRVAALKALIQQQNATGAYVRRALGFSTDQDEKVREKLRKQAATLIKEIETEGAVFTEDRVRNAVAPFVLAAKEARKPFEAMRKDIENAMRAEAQKLPVWSWWGGIRGCGPLGLAIIIGETGDLSNYATVSRVWKRLGLAVIGGKAQGHPGTGASAEDWISHGYNPRRRSALWTVGDSLMKGNETGKYRKLYLARKQIELDKATAGGREMSDGHRHRRAQRYMEKTLIADLWANWNGKVRVE
jgi:hypothetical protein